MQRRRIVLASIQLPLLAFAGGAVAQDAVRFRQNIEYRAIEPQPVETGNRIEVIDFFWYGCPFCNQLQPMLEDWIKRKPPDVAVRRIPAILRDSWAAHARIFYALELLNEVERLHQRVYYSYHVEELSMSKPEVMEQWAVKNGIDRKKWLDVYFSPEVDGKMARAARATKTYTIEGTPSLVVDGRYLTSGSMAPSIKEMVPVLDELVRMARARRAGK